MHAKQAWSAAQGMHMEGTGGEKQPCDHAGDWTAAHFFDTLVPVADSSAKLRMSSARGGGTCQQHG